ncbi:MAG: TolC family protein, partial [Rickettsiales bacterium]|nr:TolC family protein [Rickettsiales bacterium]
MIILVTASVVSAKIKSDRVIARENKNSVDDSDNLFSLREIIELALKNNASLKQEVLKRKLEEHNVNIQRAKFLPTVDAYTTYRRGIKFNNIQTSERKSIAFGSAISINHDEEKTDYNTAKTEVGLAYNLFNSGTDFITFRYRKYGLRASEYAEEDKTQSIIYDAVIKYYNILFLEANRSVAQESENSYLELLESIQASHGVGVASSIDRLQAENSYHSSRLDVMEADNSLKDSYTDLNVFLGRELNYTINLEKPKTDVKNISIDVDEHIRLALLNRPDLKRLRELRNQAKEKLKLMRISLLPSLSVD